MNTEFLVLAVALTVIAVDVAKAQGRDAGAPRRPDAAHWIAAEAVVLEPTTEIALALGRSLTAVDWKLQVATVDDPRDLKTRTTWVDCEGAGASEGAGSMTCGLSAEIFAQFYHYVSRNDDFELYQVQVRLIPTSRLRARYALKVRPND